MAPSASARRRGERGGGGATPHSAGDASLFGFIYTHYITNNRGKG